MRNYTMCGVVKLHNLCERREIMTQQELAVAALDRAENGTSVANYERIYLGFMEKGISQHDIMPRENVFTFKAWIAKGRVVKKGEHGVKVVSFRTFQSKDEDERSYTTPTRSTVFHISQTKELEKK